QKSTLDSQLRRVIQHLLKLENSPARAPRRGWIESIDDARVEIEYLLEKSPSLGPQVEQAIAGETRRAVKLAIRDMERHGEITPEVSARMNAAAYSAEQVLGDWLPPDPAA
ncbi:MAG: DUF29 family protein, partial [Alphaproteobacteria bacterium]|nr:DUF29 family protein [Alphaproteobacteria bacterium]